MQEGYVVWATLAALHAVVCYRCALDEGHIGNKNHEIAM
jgi:hypothetical protein